MLCACVCVCVCVRAPASGHQLHLPLSCNEACRHCWPHRLLQESLAEQLEEGYRQAIWLPARGRLQTLGAAAGGGGSGGGGGYAARLELTTHVERGLYALFVSGVRPLPAVLHSGVLRLDSPVLCAWPWPATTPPAACSPGTRTRTRTRRRRRRRRRCRRRRGGRGCSEGRGVGVGSVGKSVFVGCGEAGAGT